MEFEQNKEEDEDQENMFRELPVDEEEDPEEEEEEEESQFSNKNSSTQQIIASSSREQLYSYPSAAGKRLPDLSLRTGGAIGGGGEREHMFDKVVTPSDVGKLNRLVIPKQHAEKYFPLESSPSSSSPDPKGLLLNFEDGAGKSWRFRYSYWNSSQSYVMTKGWSRFVKDKKLDPGDVVSFLRDPSNTARLFIDWRRRPTPAAIFHHRWSPAISYPTPPPHHFLAAMPHHHHQSYLQNSYHPRFHHHHHPHPYHYDSFQLPARVIESSPAVSAAAAPKRLRLFGVNMEYSPCQEEDEEVEEEHGHDRRHQVRLPNNNNSNHNNNISPVVFPIMTLPSTTPSGGGGGGSGSRGFPAQFSGKGKSSANSLSFDLDYP